MEAPRSSWKDEDDKNGDYGDVSQCLVMTTCYASSSTLTAFLICTTTHKLGNSITYFTEEEIKAFKRGLIIWSRSHSK